MLMINSTETLENNILQLKECKNIFGDINLYMIKNIELASLSLSGNRFEQAKKTSIDFTNDIKLLIDNIDCSCVFLSKLNEFLIEYLKCKFEEQ